jgi:hypothetical protein
MHPPVTHDLLSDSGGVCLLLRARMIPSNHSGSDRGGAPGASAPRINANLLTRYRIRYRIGVQNRPWASKSPCFTLVFLYLQRLWIWISRVRIPSPTLPSATSRHVAWGLYARRALSSLDGTLLLSWYLRAMGMTIGKRVVLGNGFAQVVDPDMIEIEDGATVNAMFQAHTFEDRVLKIDRVHIRRRATLGSATVPLYGADVGERTHVAPHSAIMKREHLLPGRRYEGVPTRPWIEAAAATTRS